MTELPSGYTARHPVRREVPAIQALLDTCEEFDAGDSCVHDVELDTAARNGDIDLERSAWLIAAPDGPPAAFGWIWTRRGEDPEITADHYVHPAHREAAVDEALVDLIEVRAGELAAQAPSVERFYLFSDDAYAACGTALLGRGYERVRDFYGMRIDLEQDWRPAAEPPAGFDVRPFDPEHDGPAVHAADEDAFSEHFLYFPSTYGEWLPRHVERSDFDPSLWLLAWDGDEIAGMCWAITRSGEAYVEDLSVRKPWRRRGLALGLLHSVFALLGERGFRRIRLGVDVQNVTGALRIYERAGMRVERHFGVYVKQRAQLPGLG